MKVIRAKTAGFCMGVSLALNKLEKALESLQTDCPQPGSKYSAPSPGGATAVIETSTGVQIPFGNPTSATLTTAGTASQTARAHHSAQFSLHTWGPIIHNPQLVQEYIERGASPIKDITEAKAGASIVLRAHGVRQSTEQALRDAGFNIIDATCPRVKKAQLAIKKAFENGYDQLLLFGEADHPEVKGLLSYASGPAHVFGSVAELCSIDFAPNSRYFIAAQTTQDRNEYELIVNSLRAKLGDNLLELKTICDATKERQQEVINLCHTVKSMVIVGGFNSGNTRRLAEIATSLGVFTIHCEDGENIPLEALKKLQPVGLSAGASTPDKYINAVEGILRKA